MGMHQTSINMFLYPVRSDKILCFLVTINKAVKNDGIELKFTPSDGFL